MGKHDGETRRGKSGSLVSVFALLCAAASCTAVPAALPSAAPAVEAPLAPSASAEAPAV